ncbi:MAG: hypothetical protein LBF41_07900, partial [Deltaproteobacteria bacterium]|nr:hypothetical protein [Deltaproteobacteria bacterium]
MKIVIFEAARLGDFIESTPLIAGILKSYPGADAGVIALEKSVLEALRLFFPGLPGRLASLPGIGWPGEPDSPKDAGLNDADLENADLLINLSVSPAALEIVESLKPRMVLGPRRNSRGEPEVPPAQKLAMATLALNRRLSRLNLSDIWRSLDPNSPTRLAVPALSPDDLEKAEEVLFAGLPPGLREDIGRGLPLAAFHLGAKNRLRRWPVENHAKLAGLIFKRKPFAAVTLGSREEIPLCLGFGKFRRELCPDVPLINLGGKT